MLSSKSPESKKIEINAHYCFDSCSVFDYLKLWGKVVQNKLNKGNFGLNKLRTIVKVHVYWLLSRNEHVLCIGSDCMHYASCNKKNCYAQTCHLKSHFFVNEQ